MKKQIQQFCSKYGFESSYSGNTRTMFIRDNAVKGLQRIDAEASIRLLWNVPFKIEYQSN